MTSSKPDAQSENVIPLATAQHPLDAWSANAAILNRIMAERDAAEKALNRINRFYGEKIDDRTAMGCIRDVLDDYMKEKIDIVVSPEPTP